MDQNTLGEDLDSIYLIEAQVYEGFVRCAKHGNFLNSTPYFFPLSPATIKIKDPWVSAINSVNLNFVFYISKYWIIKSTSNKITIKIISLF